MGIGWQNSSLTGGASPRVGEGGVQIPKLMFSPAGSGAAKRNKRGGDVDANCVPASSPLVEQVFNAGSYGALECGPGGTLEDAVRGKNRPMPSLRPGVSQTSMPRNANKTGRTMKAEED